MKEWFEDHSFTGELLKARTDQTKTQLCPAITKCISLRWSLGLCFSLKASFCSLICFFNCLIFKKRRIVIFNYQLCFYKCYRPGLFKVTRISMSISYLSYTFTWHCYSCFFSPAVCAQLIWPLCYFVVVENTPPPPHLTHTHTHTHTHVS